MISWREQPTRYDIEAVHANTRRVGLVIRIRWALLIVLVIYSLLAGLAYTVELSFTDLASRMVIPAIALMLVVAYNTFYQLNYKRLGNIALWNNLQLTLDAVVVSVLVYYSGGVSSWFWSMYSLFILEAAFILPKRRGAWLLAVTCMALLGLIEFLELLHLMPHIVIPFAAAEQYLDPVYVSVRYMWQLAVLAGTAAVATQLVGQQRSEAAVRQSLVVLDETTGLFSRAYFLRALSAEVRRALRSPRPLHVILIDIDRFGVFNQRFGIEAGDALLRLIADEITRSVSDVGDVTVTTNLVARFGGEEFVVMLAEDDTIDGPPQAVDALRLAEQLCRRIGLITLDGAGVTVSVGVASLPTDGASADELLDAADAALAAAVEGGGDRVALASELLPRHMEDEIEAEFDAATVAPATPPARDEQPDVADDENDGFDASDLRSLDD